MRQQKPFAFLPQASREPVTAINGEKAKLHAIIDHTWAATAAHRRGELFMFITVAIRTWRETDAPTIPHIRTELSQS